MRKTKKNIYRLSGEPDEVELAPGKEVGQDWQTGDGQEGDLGTSVCASLTKCSVKVVAATKLHSC